ncbi:MAG TPA: NAD(+) diphosphatase [Angustibacter sp.]|nr:NAD(+) diphosphatase [Angustibacter sp.]
MSAPREQGSLDLPELALTRAVDDRAAARRGPTLLAELLGDPRTRVVEVSRGRAQLAEDGDGLRWRSPVPADAARLGVFLGEQQDVAYVAVGLADDEAPADDDPSWPGLRSLAAALGPVDAGLVVQAVAVLNWHDTHRFCPRCGAPTEVVEAGYVRRCTADGSQHWPRTDPAVIMTVVDDDDRLLLGRHVGWPSGRFSTLAGFVEPGESLEAAVRREVLEEVGLAVGEVAYRGSQPWPFPSSVMLGFTARALGTDVRPDGDEIAEARWFTRDELREAVDTGVVGLSPRVSISRALVEHWYGERLPDPPPS